MTDQVTLVVLGTFKPNSAETFAEYAAAAGPMLIAGGGRPFARFKVIETLKGWDGPQVISMMNFDSADQIRAVFDSDEYRAIAPMRDAAFSDLSLLIAETA